MNQHRPQFAAVIVAGVWLLVSPGCGSDDQPAAVPETVAISPEVVTSEPVRRQSPDPAQDHEPGPDYQATSAIDDPLTQKAGPAETGSDTDTRLRISDNRPDLNEARLQALGIRIFRSDRLILLTDRADPSLAFLPPLADHLFVQLQDYFGPLPPAQDGSNFQVTGYLISDESRFQSAGLMPAGGLALRHGLHLGYEFWMRDQSDDYYRRHLLLHEFTHCFMMCESGVEDTPEAWYIEGMAEYFATHELQAGATQKPAARFGIMPQSYSGFAGWGRISEMRRAFDSQPTQPLHALAIPELSEVRLYEVPNVERDSRYAWWWALCWLISEHPFYQEQLEPLKTVRSRREFFRVLDQFEREHEQRWRTDWLLFTESLREGFDPAHAFPVHRSESAEQLPDSPTAAELSLQADRGWQDTGVELQAGETVQIVCEGQFAVSESPEPWISEPQGVSVEYFNGQPLGRVVGILVGRYGDVVSSRFAVGRTTELTAPFAGRVWLQINDSSASRADNSGQVHIQLTKSASAASP